jgi:hypothetical protein
MSLRCGGSLPVRRYRMGFRANELGPGARCLRVSFAVIVGVAPTAQRNKMKGLLLINMNVYSQPMGDLICRTSERKTSGLITTPHLL